MQVKIGETYYSSRVEPILLVFEPQELQDIADLEPDQLDYCLYPPGASWPTVRAWMKGVTEESEPVDETAG